MITSGPLEVTNSIIANNYGESGAIYVDEETPNIPSKVIFHNNLIMDNYAKNNKIFVIEQSTAKDSNIDGNDFGTTNTTIIVDDKTGTFQIPTKFININPITPNPKPTKPVTPNTPNPKPTKPVTPNTPANPETNTTKPATNSSNNHTDNIINNIVSAISNEVNKIVSNENKIVSNSTESNVNVGTDSSQEAKTGDSEKSVHELLDKDVSKQTQINPIPFIIVLIIVFAVLIFGYYRYKKNE